MNHLLRLAIALLLAFPLLAQTDSDRDGYVDALLPFAIDSDRGTHHGAYGSRWSTDVWLRSGVSHLDPTIQRDGACNLDPIQCTILGGVTFRQFIYHAGQADRGVLLSFRPALVPYLQLTVRLFEHSRSAQPNGVELPVIWEGGYLRSEAMLLAIPRAESSRVALRIYDPRRASAEPFEIDFFDGSRLLGTASVQTALQPGSNLYLPAYVALNDLADLFPYLKTVDRFDVRVRPLRPGAEFWTFITVTHKETQHVLLVTPP